MTGNAGVDIFGRRLGSKVSKAAALAARPGGATMLEIIAATGGDKRHTKYNIFKILEAEGHTVRREGGRLFLEHKDGVSTKNDAVAQPWAPSSESERRLQVQALAPPKHVPLCAPMVSLAPIIASRCPGRPGAARRSLRPLPPRLPRALRARQPHRPVTKKEN
jgi:hypothetical protein